MCDFCCCFFGRSASACRGRLCFSIFEDPFVLFLEDFHEIGDVFLKLGLFNFVGMNSTLNMFEVVVISSPADAAVGVIFGGFGH